MSWVATCACGGWVAYAEPQPRVAALGDAHRAAAPPAEADRHVVTLTTAPKVR